MKVNESLTYYIKSINETATVCYQPQIARTKQITSVIVCYSAVLWGGALRDDTKNGCVADYISQ